LPSAAVVAAQTASPTATPTDLDGVAEDGGRPTGTSELEPSRHTVMLDESPSTPASTGRIGAESNETPSRHRVRERGGEGATMSDWSLFRLAALSGFVSAVSIIVGKALMLLPGEQAGEIADFLSPLFGLGAIVGVYLFQRSQAGVYGAVAFVVVFIGLALVTSLDFFGAFVRLELTEELREELLEGTPGLAMAFSAMIFLAGVVMFGISLWRAGVYPRPAGWLFVVGFAFVPLVEVVGETVVAIGSILAGISVLWLSAVLWSGSSRARRSGFDPSAGPSTPPLTRSS
jgi:hypothetical protein